MVRHFWFALCIFPISTSCNPQGEGSTEVQSWITTNSFWNKKEGVVELDDFSCQTMKEKDGKIEYGYYGGGCTIGSGSGISSCILASGKEPVVSKSVNLNNKKTIRSVTCDYIQHAYDHFQGAYASGKCSASFQLQLSYRPKSSVPEGSDLYIRASPSKRNDGSNLKKALISQINMYRDENEEKLTCD